MSAPSVSSGSALPARVRVWSDELQSCAWVLLPRAAQTVRDVCAALAAKLGLATAASHDLFMDDALVLPEEDARLLRDGDEVALRTKRPCPSDIPAPAKRARLAPPAVAPVAAASPMSQQQQCFHGVVASPRSAAPPQRPLDPRLAVSSPTLVHGALGAVSGKAPRRDEDVIPAPAQHTLQSAALVEEVASASVPAPVNTGASVPEASISHADLQLKRSFQEMLTVEPKSPVSPLATKMKTFEVRADISSVTCSANRGKPPLPNKAPVPETPRLQSKPLDLVKAAAKKCTAEKLPVEKENVSARQGAASLAVAPLPPNPEPNTGDASIVPHSPKVVGDRVIPAETPVKSIDAGGTSRVPQNPKAVGDVVLSEQVPAKSVDTGKPEMPMRSSEPSVLEKNENSMSHASRRPYKKPDKPTNIYTAGRSYPGDRDRNSQRDRDVGRDRDAEINYDVDRDRNIERDGDAGWNYNANRGRNTGRDRGLNRNSNTGRDRSAGRDYFAKRNSNTDRDRNVGRDRDVEMNYKSERNRSNFRDRGAERNYNADRAFNSGRKYGRNRDYNADRDYYGERYFNGDRNYHNDSNREMDKDYNAERDDNQNRDYDEDRDRRSRALQERQYNESFRVGLESESKISPEENMLSKDKSDGKDQEMKAADELDHTTAEETKKELEEMFRKDKAEKSGQPSKTQEYPSLKTLNKVAEDLVCENTLLDGSCTILDMLRSGNASRSDDDTGFYCRVQVFLGFGTVQTSTPQISSWIRLLLAPRPTDKNELRISKVNAEALSVLRRSGNAAKQRSPGSAMVRRGANLKENLPILLNPDAIHKFSFDIRSLSPDDKFTEHPKLDDGGGTTAEKAVVKKKPELKYSSDPLFPKQESIDREPKTGYESLAKPLTDQNCKDKPSVELPLIALDQLPVLDELPGAAADFQAELDGGSYPPLEAMDSVLDTLNDIELNTSTIRNSPAAPPRLGQSQDEKSRRKESAIPRSAPAPSLGGIVGGVPGPSHVQSRTLPVRNVASPDSVIDLVEDTRDEEFSKRKENTSFTSDYRNYVLNVMTDITSALKTLTAREDMHLRRFVVE